MPADWNHGRRVELFDNGGAPEGHADVDEVALIDRTIDGFAAETHTPRFDERVVKVAPCRLIGWKLHLGHAADSAQTIRHDFDGFCRRRMAEHLFMGFIKPLPQIRDCMRAQGIFARYRDLVTLSRVAHVERAL